MTREKKKQKKRSTIIEAACAEFTARRFDEVKLDDIASRAGVGKGTLYLYFKNKEDLFVQMAVEGVDEMAERIREITTLDEPFRERFFTFGFEIGTFVEKRCVMFRLMHQIESQTVREALMTHHRQLAAATRKLLESGVNEGALRRDLSVEEMHCSLIGPLLFRAQLNQFNEDKLKVESLIRFFWEGASVR